MKLRKKRKGSMLIVTLYFIIASFVIFAFSYDISRMFYFKLYTKNLASAMALSIVNESKYTTADTRNGARSIIVYDHAMLNSVDKSLFKGKTVVDSWENFLKMNEPGMDKSYHVTAKDVSLNPITRDFFTGKWTGVNRSKFLRGADGVNGEVTVHVTAKMDLFFFPMLFGKSEKIIHESATAQPYSHATKGSSSSTHIQGKEEKGWVDYTYYGG